MGNLLVIIFASVVCCIFIIVLIASVAPHIVDMFFEIKKSIDINSDAGKLLEGPVCISGIRSKY